MSKNRRENKKNRRRRPGRKKARDMTIEELRDAIEIIDPTINTEHATHQELVDCYCELLYSSPAHEPRKSRYRKGARGYNDRFEHEIAPKGDGSDRVLVHDNVEYVTGQKVTIDDIPQINHCCLVGLIKRSKVGGKNA